MSSHETIRVLEVEVDAAVPSPGNHVKTEAGAEERRGKALDPTEVVTQDRHTPTSTIPTGERIKWNRIYMCANYSMMFWLQPLSALNISYVNLYSF